MTTHAENYKNLSIKIIQFLLYNQYKRKVLSSAIYLQFKHQTLFKISKNIVLLILSQRFLSI